MKPHIKLLKTIWSGCLFINMKRIYWWSFWLGLSGGVLLLILSTFSDLGSATLQFLNENHSEFLKIAWIAPYMTLTIPIFVIFSLTSLFQSEWKSVEKKVNHFIYALLFFYLGDMVAAIGIIILIRVALEKLSF